MLHLLLDVVHKYDLHEIQDPSIEQQEVEPHGLQRGRALRGKVFGLAGGIPPQLTRELGSLHNLPAAAQARCAAPPGGG